MSSIELGYWGVFLGIRSDAIGSQLKYMRRYRQQGLLGHSHGTEAGILDRNIEVVAVQGVEPRTLRI
jgi:hypothetical protein